MMPIQDYSGVFRCIIVHSKLTWLHGLTVLTLFWQWRFSLHLLWVAELHTPAALWNLQLLRWNETPVGAVAWHFWTLSRRPLQKLSDHLCYLNLSISILCSWNKQIHCASVRQSGQGIQGKKYDAFIFVICLFSFLGFWAIFHHWVFVMIRRGNFCRCHAPGCSGRTRLGSDWLRITDRRRVPKKTFICSVAGAAYPAMTKVSTIKARSWSWTASVRLLKLWKFLCFDNVIIIYYYDFQGGSQVLLRLATQGRVRALIWPD